MGSLDASLVCDLPPFEHMARQDIAALLERARSIRVEKGAAVFGQDEAAHSFFLLLDGHVRVVRVTPDGEQVIARYISSGELMGIAQALGRSTYPASAIAAVDCVVLAWPGAMWTEVVSRYPGFASNTYKTVGSRLQDAQDRIVEMATERVEQRVANAVLKLAAQTGRRTEEGILIDLPISRQDISEMTGTTLHTVSRLMSAWEAAGWVKSGRQRIVVVEGHKLMLLAGGAK
ncbi:Crp/Fnr family transcriptional regulator [Hoeflea marina]|uniref:Crp/Fnr family transcriptional regulator n=1 Tax=Hoeflea marina TaxID=274592 RepID=A0A317PJW9_9HYPH|nr:Crp/Fnr family transcriptional regulator [Hoeflea marina]PWW00584.1 Crp/Fnr family transcriptional regulator [Hoeflea marina]